jgi:hypothetical protein
MTVAAYARPVTRPPEDSEAWVAALGGPPAVREPALAELHALLLRGARFELGRRRASLPHLPAGELDDLAHQAADDALAAILAKLDTFRGASRFTTWAYKFVLLEAGVKARRRAWQGREVPLDDDWPAAVGAADPRGRRGAARARRRGARVADPAPAPRVLRARARRRADRRARRAHGHHPRRALQDAARRAAQAARAADRRGSPRRCPDHGRRDMSPDRPDHELLARLLGPAGPEIGCDECFELIDEYVDLELAGEDADARLPGMRAHLEGCPACREEHESLRALASDI